MVRNDVPVAETLLRRHLKQAPTDTAAIRMLAEVAVRCGRNEDAQKLLERCLELAPGFAAARYNYAVLLHRLNDTERALAEVERLLSANPRSPAYRNLCAVILSRIGEYERSGRMYAELLNEYPAHAKLWLSYGHVLKTEGRQDDSIHAYRQSIVHDPAFGEAYWSLANLKTFRFDASGSCCDADAGGASRARCEEPPAVPLCARQGLRGLGRSRAFLRALRAGQCAAPRRASLRCGAQFEAHREAQEDVHTRVLQGPRRIRLRCARPDLHRRHAARGLDAARTDPVQLIRRWKAPPSCRRSSRWPRICAPRRIQPTLPCMRRCSPPGAPPSSARWGSATSSAHASIARRIARSSSTRCRTTSCTSA